MRDGLSCHVILNEQVAAKLPLAAGMHPALIRSYSSETQKLNDCIGCAATGEFWSSMVILNKSEAETLQQLLNGERLWSWPNGRIQLGQTFPDLAVINNLVRHGLLD